MKKYKFKQESYNNLGAEFEHNRKIYMLGFDHGKNPVLYVCTVSGEPICEIAVNDDDEFTGFGSSNWHWHDIVIYYAINKALGTHLTTAFKNMFKCLNQEIV